MITRASMLKIRQIPGSLKPHAPALIGALGPLGLMILWAARNGGYDTATWSWGAIALLALFAVTQIFPSLRITRLTAAAKIALAAFSGYVAWSYLSIAWAQTPGWALEGSDRALLYLLVFSLFVALPWTPTTGFAVLLALVIGVGVIGLVILFRFASSDHIERLAIEGRPAAPTGYFNSSVALFMVNALLATVLATRRELPGPIRGLLLALATASLQLCVMGQSRGWLFTLPIVAAVSILVVSDRLQVVAAAVFPIAGTLAILPRLVHAFPGAATTASLAPTATAAGQASLMACAAVFVLGTLIAWATVIARPPSLSRVAKRAIGIAVAVVVLAVGTAGGFAATHGDPWGFVKRQWHGFSHQAVATGGSSHFTSVGSGRYDFWRVSLNALAAHPIGGLGQDNFSDYYVRRRRTDEETRWTHSLEMRLLAHTGLVGFGLFVAFLVAAVAAVLPALRRSTGLRRAVVGAALLPMVVWLIHGSVDWFWEFPALSAPALGFLGMAAAFGIAETRARRIAPASSGAAGPDPTVEHDPGTGAEADAAGADAEAEAGATGAEAEAEAGATGAEANAAGADAEAGDGAGGGTAPDPPRRRPRRVIARVLAFAAAAVLCLAALAVLTFPYLSIREMSAAGDIGWSDPKAALSKLKTAADLNPLSPDPVRLAGTIALQHDEFAVAQQRFRQTIEREPGGWYGWLGAGLAASALGERGRAARDFRLASSIDSRQPAIQRALAAVDTLHPLAASEAFQILAAGVRG